MMEINPQINSDVKLIYIGDNIHSIFYRKTKVSIFWAIHKSVAKFLNIFCVTMHVE